MILGFITIGIGIGAMGFLILWHIFQPHDLTGSRWIDPEGTVWAVEADMKEYVVMTTGVRTTLVETSKLDREYVRQIGPKTWRKF